ncbi:putative leucine-rich repeat-containing protein DDB_G0290503 [Cimex lectularius]|uniref:Uncharacterized protein n=1 Tax=Cimex lectularius TaxID=79782 RepID=A0A8I6RXL0_CIMLE|nr:putative leucine-rich repeat-containing protein DDB_G0290503 [Cimex lectularius]
MAKSQSKDFQAVDGPNSPKDVRANLKDSWAQTTPDLNYGFTLKHPLTLEDPDGIDLFHLGCYLGWKAKPFFQSPQKVFSRPVINVGATEIEETGDTTLSQEVQKGRIEVNKDSGDHGPVIESSQSSAKKISKQLTSEFMKSYSENEMFLAKWLGGDVLSKEEPASLHSTVLTTIAEKDEIVQPKITETPNVLNEQKEQCKNDNIEENNKVEIEDILSESEELIVVELPNKAEKTQEENETHQEIGANGDNDDKQPNNHQNQINNNVMQESCTSLQTYIVDQEEHDEITLEESSSTVCTEVTITGELSEGGEIESDYDDNLDSDRAESIIYIKYCCDRANRDYSSDRYEYETEDIDGESEYCLWDENIASPDDGDAESVKTDSCSSIESAKSTHYTSAYSQEQNCFVQILDELRIIKEDIQRQASKQNKTQEEISVQQSSSKEQSVNDEQMVFADDKQPKISIEITEKCDNCHQKQVLQDYIQIMTRIQKRLSDGTSEYRALEDINLISQSENILEPLMRMRETNKDPDIDEVLQTIIDSKSSSSKSVSSEDTNVANSDTKNQEMDES